MGLIDLYPTLLDAVSGEVSPHVLGRSLLPEIRNREAGRRVRDTAFCEIHHDGSLDYMVRTERHKWFIERGGEHLYDLDSDPYEQTNLIESVDHQNVAKEMRDRLRQFLMTARLNHSQGYRPLVERVRQENSLQPVT